MEEFFRTLANQRVIKLKEQIQGQCMCQTRYFICSILSEIIASFHS